MEQSILFNLSFPAIMQIQKAYSFFQILNIKLISLKFSLYSLIYSSLLLNTYQFYTFCRCYFIILGTLN